jgi:signal transduction histidine kinase
MASRLSAQLSQLDALITRMLGFVKTNARERELSALEPLVRSQIEVVAPLFAKRSIELVLQWQAPDCEIAVDRLQIGSAVLALLENALQHAPTGSRVSVACISQGHRVAISVSDEGPGIAPEMAARLFEPFATGRPTGTGLGLAIARAAAQAHRGELSFTPCQPSGVCFTLALPALPQV